jgi:glycosyltransferase involved in cell wall biosynthesis
MKTPDPKILFISHDASRTGAPMLLLHFIRWFKTNTGLPFETLLREGGDLQPDFEALGRVSVLRPWRGSAASARHLVKRVHNRRILRRLAASDINLIYSNTVTNGPVLNVLAKPGRMVVSHIHELEARIRRLGPATFDAVRRNTHRYIACSEAVKANLVNRHAIDPATVNVIHEFIDTSLAQAVPQLARELSFAEIGIPKGSLVVGGAGSLDWRKGPDLFIQLAAAVCRTRPDLPVHFVWIGGMVPGIHTLDELRHDVDGLGLVPRIHFVGERSNVLDYFRAFDVFALTSREDPFPLVCLEAASVGLPIVCFDGAGGEKELVEDDCGFVVPYLDIPKMAERTVELLESEALRQRCGRRASAKVQSRHDVSVAAPQIVAVLKAFL